MEGQLHLPQDQSNADDWHEFWSSLADEQPEVVEGFSTLRGAQLIFRLATKCGDYGDFDGEYIDFMQEGYDKYRSSLFLRTVEKKPIAEALKDLSPDDNGDTLQHDAIIKNIAVILDGDKDHPKRAYFICDNTISFRHEGDGRKKPRKVFLRTLAGTVDDTRVLVFYSSSGSGKTVELAASSVTRNADISFVFSVREDSEPNEHDINQAYTNVKEERFDGVMYDQDGSQLPPYYQQCKKQTYILAAWRRIEETLCPLIIRAKQELETLLEATRNHSRNSGSDSELRIVLAIDEAASCPKLIRSINRDPTYAIATAVTDCLGRHCNTANVKIVVKISIAGTGVGASIVGSLPKKFRVVRPTHEDEQTRREIFNTQLPSLDVFAVGFGGKRKLENVSDIQETLPVVSALMQNGRMGSIAIAAMMRNPSDIPINEARLVEKIVNSYMESNGMCGLLEEDKTKLQPQVAALALAIHFFKDRFKLITPENLVDFQAWISEMKFDVPVSPALDKSVNIKTIVERYGLLEPSTFDVGRGSAVDVPLQMKSAQQLVAAYMLGVSLTGMLELTPLGFEFLSTHFVKCAIAAGNAISFAERPSLQDTLSVVGFMIDKRGTAESVVNDWNETKNWKPVGFTTDQYSLFDRTYSSNTVQLNVGLRIFEGDDGGDEELLIDKSLYNVLRNMKAETQVDKTFASPLACVNYGNSPLPDGFVVFLARSSTSERVEKLCVMIQAKDYYGASGIDGSSLNRHADRAAHVIFDELFGTKRLLGVASEHDTLFVKRTPTNNMRKFVPFAFNESFMMRDLLVQMSRDEKVRVEKYAKKIKKLKRSHSASS